MLFTTLLPLTLLTGVLASPLPASQPTTCDTLTTNLDYYQGVTLPDCGIRVFQGNITSGVCINITTQGLMLYPANTNCTFYLWAGVTNCSGGVTKSFNLGATGNPGTCVATGVMDGGKWYHGSGYLSCGCA
ncbi:hypothetical protein DSL72_006744 [Monilinia vaccinii-corymbosi]|uniref:Uncharacterized protein n=1 Tax=Monilinia vaccinii-corymbosi TaxID=61207 RepID=A0A8A3PPR6_9HELO|nr:hypothetical protein DSL72_006744 [Monilinia vaccinii-corymbosi]